METAVIRLTDIISESATVAVAPIEPESIELQSASNPLPEQTQLNQRPPASQSLPTAWRPSSALAAVVAAALSVRVNRPFRELEAAKPIRLWVFSGGSNTISLSISRSQLVSASLFIFLLFFGVGFGTARYAGVYLDSRDFAAATLTANAQAVEQVALTLNANSETEAEPASLSSSEAAPETVTPPDSAPAASAVLVDQLQRIKRYEAALKKRAAFIDALLDDVEKLDFDFSEPSAQAEHASRSRHSRWGIGGGEVSRAPVIRAPREAVNPAASQKSEGSTSATLESSAAPTGEDAKQEEGVKKISLLLSDLDLQLSRLASVPLGAPVQGRLSSGFGSRFSPFSGRSQTHSGIDFSVDRESTVLATADGIVLNAGWKGAYGNTVIIKHGSRVETLYGHLSRILVKPGQRICRGQEIALVGSTGRSTGPHVHYEVRIDGDAIDPSKFVKLASFFRLLWDGHDGIA